MQKSVRPLEKLDAKYAQVVGELVKDGSLDEAGKFVTDTEGFSWAGGIKCRRIQGSWNRNGEKGGKVTCAYRCA